MDGGRNLYLVLDVPTGLFKIGRADDPWARLKSLRTGNASELALLAVAWSAGDHEPVLHHRFAGHRVRGEWFAAGARPTVEAIVMALPDGPVLRYCHECRGITGDGPGAGCMHDVPEQHRDRSSDHPMAVCAEEGCAVGPLAVHRCCAALAEAHYGAWYCRAHRPR